MKYTNPNKGTCVTINHKSGHVRLSYGDVVELPSDVDASKLVARGHVKVVEEAPKTKPSKARVTEAPAQEDKTIKTES
jgi:hypothetical protein